MLGPVVIVGLAMVIALILAWGAGRADWTSVVIGAGVVVLVAILLVGDRLRTWWTTNILRNNLDARRRLRRCDDGEGGSPSR